MPEAQPLLTLVETRAFARRRPELLSDEEYRLAQIALARNPEVGKVIQGSGGIRKVRWELEGRGKRGGARVIYYWAVNREIVLLLGIYAKGEAESISRDQLKALATVVKEEFK
jgi:mRNA-degrading endonuclease RelE of RelBE toxin-antitoxin system